MSNFTSFFSIHVAIVKSRMPAFLAAPPSPHELAVGVFLSCRRKDIRLPQLTHIQLQQWISHSCVLTNLSRNHCNRRYPCYNPTHFALISMDFFHYASTAFIASAGALLIVIFCFLRKSCREALYCVDGDDSTWKAWKIWFPMRIFDSFLIIWHLKKI